MGVLSSFRTWYQDDNGDSHSLWIGTCSLDSPGSSDNECGRFSEHLEGRVGVSTNLHVLSSGFETAQVHTNSRCFPCQSCHAFFAVIFLFRCHTALVLIWCC